jgi:hypothetical protein
MPTYLGNNDLGSRELFNQRVSYFFDGYSSTIAPIDMWNNKPFYGKLDPNGATIYPIERTLKRLNSAPDDNLFVLNFVADAFEDFRKHYIFTQQLDAKGSMFENLIPKKAYENPLLNWNDYMNSVFLVFKDGWLTSDKRDQKIISFRDYITEFEVFLREMGPILPITLTNYILSTQVSPLISGLIIELSDANHGDDLSKSLFYMKNKCFPCYVEAAQKYGFKVDKNAPWRLVADLKSPALLPYLNKYGLSFTSLFNMCYTKAYNTEINLIKNFLFESYSAFVGESPEVSIYKYYGRCKKTLQKVIRREEYMEQKINEQFPDHFWIGYYIQLLANETPNVITSKDILDLTSTSQTLIRKGLDETAYKLVFDSFNKTD